MLKALSENKKKSKFKTRKSLTTQMNLKSSFKL